MSFHYTPDTANALLRQHAENHLKAQIEAGAKNRATLPKGKLQVLSGLLGRLYHANGQIEISYQELALVTFEPNSDTFSEAVAYGVELGLLEPPKPIKVVTDKGYATNGMLLRLTVKGKELTQLVTTKEGQQLGYQYIRENYHRMDRKGRTKPRQVSTSPCQHLDVILPENGHDKKHRPPSRSNTAHPLGETPPTLEASNSSLDPGLYIEKKRIRRDIEEKKELSPPLRVEQHARENLDLMVQAAINHFDALQGFYGGATSDQDSFDVIRAACHGKSVTDVQQALGAALARGWSYWKADKPLPRNAGHLTAAVRDEWTELEPDSYSPDAPSILYWDSETCRWQFEDGSDPIGLIELPQPLQTVTDANATASVNPACSAPSLIPQTPKKTERETHASIDKQTGRYRVPSQAELDAIEARVKQKHLTAA